MGLDRLARSIGPYGGSKESEKTRPISLGLYATAVVFIMTLGLLALLVLCGDYLGPVIVILTTFFQFRWPRLPGNELPRNKVIILDGLWWTGVVLTLLVIYIGGSPIQYYRAAAGELVMEHPWGATMIPIWIETFRLSLIITLTAGEFICIMLLSRLLTEILYPSLPNSIVAAKGLLKGTYPYMQTKNMSAEDEIVEDEGIIPEAGPAPKRPYL